MTNQFEQLSFRPLSSETWQSMTDQGLDERLNAYKPHQWLESEYKDQGSKEEVEELNKALEEVYGSGVIGLLSQSKIVIVKIVYLFK